MHIIINNNLISVSILNAFNNLIYDANHEQIERQIVHKPVHNKQFFFFGNQNVFSKELQKT